MPGNQNNDMKSLADINLTPFVDIMLCLLIIFMITAPMMQHGLDVNLPQAKSPVMERTQEDLILTVKRDGSIFLGNDNTPVTIGFLEEKLEALYKDREKKDLYIKADENVVYGRVVSVMSIAKAAGVERIGMITKPVSNIREEEGVESSEKNSKNSKDKGQS